MAHIAYVDHSYHKTTKSTMFLPEILARRGHDVEIFWDEAWRGGTPVHWESVAGHEVVVMFQSYCPHDGRRFRSLHPNVVYIPMFDQFGFSQSWTHDLSPFWEAFKGSKVLSFSTSVHTLANGFGIASHLAHYYPEARPVPPTIDGLRGFFWLRRENELGWSVVRRLLGAARFDTFHLHVVGDPGFPPVQLPPDDDLQTYNVTMSNWFDRRSDFEEVASRANIYFAPRLAEGIGQTFLEAMARGQCVVAADRSTMNEYIVHGVNGLLFEPRSPAPLDFSEISRLGREARRGIIAGRTRWEEAEEALVDFILTPSAALYGRNSVEPSAAATSNTQSLRSVPRRMTTAVRRRLLN